MEWDELIIMLFLILPAIGLPIALALRKKGGQKKLDEMLEHLRGIGVRASRVEDEGEGEKTGRKRSWGERSEGVIAIEGRNMDSINVVSVSSQYGNTYYAEYMVNSPWLAARADAKKTSMVKKKSPPLFGKVVDIEWRGDPYLAQRLNFDYSLKYKLMQPGPNRLKGGISIHPEPKFGYTRVRTSYQLPSPELFEVIDAIAKYIKSAV
jgi:hypothetical protein